MNASSMGTVLVVDDQPMNRVVLGRMVRKAGLDVVEAANGAECLDHLQRAPPGHFQCILMDLQMPVMDGWEAAQRVRAWEANVGSPPADSHNDCCSHSQHHDDVYPPFSHDTASPTRVGTCQCLCPQVSTEYMHEAQHRGTGRHGQLLETSEQITMPFLMDDLEQEEPKRRVSSGSEFEVPTANLNHQLVQASHVANAQWLASAEQRVADDAALLQCWHEETLLDTELDVPMPQQLVSQVHDDDDEDTDDDDAADDESNLGHTFSRQSTGEQQTLTIQSPQQIAASNHNMCMLMSKLDACTLAGPSEHPSLAVNAAKHLAVMIPQQQQLSCNQSKQPGSRPSSAAATPPSTNRIPIVACTTELLSEPPLRFRRGISGIDTVMGASRNENDTSVVTAQSHALSCGVDECVNKPLSFDQLCSIFNRYIPGHCERDRNGPRTPPKPMRSNTME